MKIEELSVISFGTVRQYTCKIFPSDRLSLCDANGNNAMTADFLTYMFYGKIPSHLLTSGNVLHGILTVSTEKGMRLRIDRKTEINDGGMPADVLSVTDLDQNSPLYFENTVGEELFGIDALLFAPLATLGTKAPLPEHLHNVSAVLLDHAPKKSQIDHALHRIDEASSSLLRPNKKGGAIYELEKKLSALESSIDLVDQATKRTKELKEELSRTQDERNQTDTDLQTLLELKRAYGNLTVIREYDRLHAIEDDLDLERKNYEAFLDSHRVGSFLPTDEYYQEVSDLQEKVTDTVRTYTEARTALNLLESEEDDRKTLSALDAVQKKYGEFNNVKETANVLFRRASHTLIFACIALLASAFFAVCTLLVGAKNAGLAIVLLLLTLCCVSSSIVLHFSRRQFTNALLILCRQFGVKNQNELLTRLRFLEDENTRLELRKENLRIAKENLANAKNACATALETLNQTTEKWGHRIAPEHALANFEVLLDEIRYFLNTKRNFLERIAQKERRVSMARKVLSNQNEIAVRALVSPFKRKNLCQLERENRLKEITRGIDFYNRQLDILNRRIEHLRAEHAETAARIGDPLSLYRERNDVAERRDRLLSIYRSYLLFKKALQEKNAEAPIIIDESTEQLGTPDSYLALGDLLLREKIPFAIQENVLSEQELQNLLALCQKQNRQIFLESSHVSSVLSVL